MATDLLPHIGRIVTEGAKARANVRTGRMRGEIDWDIGEDSQGLFVSIGTVFYGYFLEKPARQLHRAYRFLSTALNDLAGRI